MTLKIVNMSLNCNVKSVFSPSLFIYLFYFVLTLRKLLGTACLTTILMTWIGFPNPCQGSSKCWYNWGHLWYRVALLGAQTGGGGAGPGTVHFGWLSCTVMVKVQIWCPMRQQRGSRQPGNKGLSIGRVSEGFCQLRNVRMQGTLSACEHVMCGNTQEKGKIRGSGQALRPA